MIEVLWFVALVLASPVFICIGCALVFAFFAYAMWVVAQAAKLFDKLMPMEGEGRDQPIRGTFRPRTAPYDPTKTSSPPLPKR